MSSGHDPSDRGAAPGGVPRRWRVLPGRRVPSFAGAAAAFAAMATVALARGGEGTALLGWAIALLAIGFAAAFAVDVAWTMRRLARHPIRFERHLPDALALGRPSHLRISLSHEGPWAWQVQWFDHAPAQLAPSGLPARVDLPARSCVDASYGVTPLRRGRAVFEPASLRVRSCAGLAELQWRAGASQALRVLPDFAALSGYAWLAGDRRLAEIGIKTFAARGAGTDFEQLGEYEPGTPTRHIDWKASQRVGRPVVRQFQDERDQSVMFLLDCGRRMKADDGAGTATRGGPAGSHFDQVLDAMMLLSYVALKAGDAVGAMTFAQEPAAARLLAPAKGLAALGGLVAALHDVQPGPAHPDYAASARDLMRRLPRRSLVILLTNFRDEDAQELRAALRLLRTRHLVLVASLKERVLESLREQPLDSPAAAAEIGAAHGFEQARAEAFARLASREALMVDAPPEQFAAALVNRYHAVKRARLL